MGKRDTNELIFALEKTLDAVKSRIQRFKNTVDPSLMAADAEIQNGIKSMNDRFDKQVPKPEPKKKPAAKKPAAKKGGTKK